MKAILSNMAPGEGMGTNSCQSAVVSREPVKQASSRAGESTKSHQHTTLLLVYAFCAGGTSLGGGAAATCCTRKARVSSLPRLVEHKIASMFHNSCSTCVHQKKYK